MTAAYDEACAQVADMTPEQLIDYLADNLRLTMDPNSGERTKRCADASIRAVRDRGVLNLTQMRMAQRKSRNRTRK